MSTHAQRYFDISAARKKPQIIIDTDPGIDDAAAILMALGLEKMGILDVLALTCVAGNVGLFETSKNARVIADWAMRRNLPVYAGAEKPLLKPLLTAQHVHGNHGLGKAQLHKPKTPLQDACATTYLIDTLSQAEPYSITLCAVGPLTNLAHVFNMAPQAARGIKEIVIMGGAYFNIGNITPMAEFNFFVDPHAAQIVLNSGIPIRIMPLDVTHQARLSAPRLQALRQLNNENGQRLADLFDDYQLNEYRDVREQGAPLHDPCAIAAAVWPELFSSKRVHVAIETQGELTMGACVVDWHNKFKHLPNAHWATAVDDDALFEILTQAIGQLI